MRLDFNSRLVPALAGRVLAYGDEASLAAVIRDTGTHERSGVVVAMKSGAVDVVRHLSRTEYSQPTVVDVRRWSSEIASVESPLALPVGDGLFPLTLDDWGAGILRAGASAVLTPSRFVRLADWPSLKAVISAGNSAVRQEIITLVATDVGMLDGQNLSQFVDIVGEAKGPLAFLFASAQPPFEKRGRAAAMRALVIEFPGAILIGVDALIGLDGIVRGAQATAIGVTGSLRRPHRPGDQGGPPARQWMPGMFIRELWEQRSPTIYADWYEGRPSPMCEQCGRRLDIFGNSPSEKLAILSHGVHAWLSVLTEMSAQPQSARTAWLASQRQAGFEAHADLRPRQITVEADRLLRQLVELDDPQGRRTTPAGTWQ